MKRNIFIRLITCLLVLCMLTACGGDVTPSETDEPSETESKTTEPTGTDAADPDPTDPEPTNPEDTVPTEPESTETDPVPTEPEVTEPEPTEPTAPSLSMPENKLNLALLQLEYAMLPFNAGLGDFDRDGNAELFCGDIGLSFDIADGRSATFYFSQSGITFYTDKSGNIYMSDSYGGDYFDEEAGVYMEGYDVWFSTYNGSEWETALGNGYSLTMTYTWDEEAQAWVDEKIEEEVDTYVIGDKEVTGAEYREHLQNIGLTNDFPKMELHYDAFYAESIFAALEARLGEAYSLTTLRKDINGDGLEEVIFAAADLWAPWRNNMHRNFEDEWHDTAAEVIQYGVPLDQVHTGILIASIGPEMLIFNAYNVVGDVKLTQNTEIYHGFGQIQIDGIQMETYEYVPY